MIILSSVINEWIHLVTALPKEQIIRANQNGPRNTGDRATYQATIAEITQSEEKKRYAVNDNTGRVRFRKRAQVTVSIDFWGDTAQSNAAAITQSSNLYRVRGLFLQNEISILNFSSVRDLTSVGDTKFTQRHQIDVTLLAWVDIDDQIDRVREINFTINLRPEE